MDPKRPFRLAIRDEGSFVACYLARSGTMEGAVLIATLAKAFAQVPGAFDAWQQTLTKALVGALEIGGNKVEGVEISGAPEHEKAGHA